MNADEGKMPPTRVLRCFHCENTTPHECLFECSAPATWCDSDGELMDNDQDDCPDPENDYVLIRCQTCFKVSLYWKFSRIDWDEAFQANEAVLEYPVQYSFPLCVPEVISSIYYEAKRIQNRSPNAFAVLLRRALEAICNDRGATKGSLAVRLKELAKRREIPEQLAEISSVLRELGNAGAHHSSQRVTISLTWMMDAFFKTLVEYLYVAPDRLKEFRSDLARYDKSKKL